MDLQEQVKAYTAWVNSQLKKRSQHIKDLRVDLQDGLALVTVVEIVSGQTLGAINPTTEEDKKENIEKVLNFMKSNGIKLHHVSADEIISGNVKTIMQLILALAAHFKPASIGGRRHRNDEYCHHNPTSHHRHRWKNFSHENSPTNSENEAKLKERQIDMEEDLGNVRRLAESLQKLILEELENQPVEFPNPLEDSVILQAKIDQSYAENWRLEKEVEKLQVEIRNVSSEKAVVENRLQRHEEEVLALRQDLLHSNLDRDKLLSEKAELTVELEEAQSEREKFRKQLNKKEMVISELEDEIHFAKTQNAVLLSRKDREITQLQMQLKNSANVSDGVFHEHSLNRLPQHSPVLPRSPNSPVFPRASGSPKLSRRSPVSKNHPPRRNRFTPTRLDSVNTRILYFTDRDMTPAMATVGKRVGDITLKDFKDAIRKDGNYRYVFKALDPELGTVKEEVTRDDDIIPGWEGKIVAWVEEELQV